jgi:hypothetical protein
MFYVRLRERQENTTGRTPNIFHFFSNIRNAYEFFKKIILTLSLLLKKYMHITCLMYTYHIYRLN